jgi:hypothetical protein
VSVPPCNEELPRLSYGMTYLASFGWHSPSFIICL